MLDISSGVSTLSLWSSRYWIALAVTFFLMSGGRWAVSLSISDTVAFFSGTNTASGFCSYFFWLSQVAGIGMNWVSSGGRQDARFESLHFFRYASSESIRSLWGIDSRAFAYFDIRESAVMPSFRGYFSLNSKYSGVIWDFFSARVFLISLSR